MRVGVDAKPLLPPRAGVARYLEGLIAGCAELEHPDLELALVSPGGRRRTLPWVLWDLQRATGRGYDVFHFPFYYPPLAPRCPVTVAVHDVLVLEHPEWFPYAWASPLRRLIPAGVRRAAAIFTFSSSVAEAISQRCGVQRRRIHVAPHGVDCARFAPPPPELVTSIRARFTLTHPYLFQFGAIEPRRGSDLVLAACAALRARHPDLELVIAGDVRADVPVLRQPRPWLRLLGRVDDNVLPALYSGAAVVVAPSRGEGFDLPLLEALACGAAVVASDIPVHREHFTPAVALFESGDAEALHAAVAHALEDSEVALRLRAAGPALAARFTWRESARRHLEVWRAVGPR
jgi:glycosyltransferase involved in cell wall biosynthesis